jgi:hypothetical protein
VAVFGAGADAELDEELRCTSPWPSATGSIAANRLTRRASARREFGNVALVKEITRDIGAGNPSSGSCRTCGTPRAAFAAARPSR